MGRRGRKSLIEGLMQSAFDLAWAVNHAREKRAHGRKPLTFSRLMVLRLLAKKGYCSVSDVAAFLGVSEADASTLADKLVGQRLLQRMESRSDRRIKELSLTPAAGKLLSECDRTRKRLLDEAFRQCSAEDLQHASDVLERVSWCLASGGHAPGGGEKTKEGMALSAGAGSGLGGV
jgi:DNA-binding MarR family transcriptional regulator